MCILKCCDARSFIYLYICPYFELNKGAMEKVFIVRSYFYDCLICMYFVICFYILLEEVHFLTIVSVQFQHNPEWLNKYVLFLNVPYFTLSVNE